MTDNINLTPGTGVVVAADEVVDGTLGTVLVGYGKIMDGTLDGTNKLTITASGAAKIDGSATTQPVSGTVTANIGTVSTLSTAAKQDTGNTSVASIDTKTPALGQALSAASVPVVLPAAQITTLTPQTNALTDTQLRATAVPVTTGGLTDTQLRATAVPVSTGLTQPTTPSDTQPISATALPLPAGAATASKQDALLAELQLKADLTETQPVSAASLPLPSGAATSAKQLPDNHNVVVTSAPTTAVTGPLTDTQLRQTPVPVSMTSDIEIGAVELKNGSDDTRATVTASNALKVDGSAVTQPVSNTNLDVALSTRLKPADTLTAVTTVGTITNVVHVDDNASSLTVDNGGTFATQVTSIAAGNNNIGDVDVVTLPIAFNTGTRSATTQRVTIATDDSVPVTGTFWQTTQPISIAATVATKETQPSAATLTNVTMTASSVALAASNASRRSLMIYNDTGVTVYVKLGTTASSTSFTIKMVDQSYYELPNPVYTGVIEALGASGSVRVTEI